MVAVVGWIACNIAQSPHCLLLNVLVWTAQQLDELRYSTCEQQQRVSRVGWAWSVVNEDNLPDSMTIFVCWDVPDAMLVSAQAASNCKVVLSLFFRNSTKRGTIPVWMTSSMGGLGSRESSFLNFWVAFNCSCTSLLYKAWTEFSLTNGCSCWRTSLSCNGDVRRLNQVFVRPYPTTTYMNCRVGFILLSNIHIPSLNQLLLAFLFP